jgi:serine/threonine-protein kinase
MAASRARILAVDDEPRAVELVAHALPRIGDVECASSGEEAWQLARRFDFDLVISDQRMPGMSGVELLTRIANKSLHTGRILITAFSAGSFSSMVPSPLGARNPLLSHRPVWSNLG